MSEFSKYQEKGRFSHHKFIMLHTDWKMLGSKGVTYSDASTASYRRDFAKLMTIYLFASRLPEFFEVTRIPWKDDKEKTAWMKYYQTFMEIVQWKDPNIPLWKYFNLHTYKDILKNCERQDLKPGLNWLEDRTCRLYKFLDSKNLFDVKGKHPKKYVLPDWRLQNQYVAKYIHAEGLCDAATPQEREEGGIREIPYDEFPICSQILTRFMLMFLKKVAEGDQFETMCWPLLHKEQSRGSCSNALVISYKGVQISFHLLLQHCLFLGGIQKRGKPNDMCSCHGNCVNPFHFGEVRTISKGVLAEAADQPTKRQKKMHINP